MNDMKITDIHVHKIIEKIAAAEGITVKDVLDAMQEALVAGYHNPSPEVQANWKKVPTNGDVIAPENFIIWAAEAIAKQNIKESSPPYDCNYKEVPKDT